MKEADIRKYAALMKELELTGLEITEDNRVVRLERMIGETARLSAPTVPGVVLCEILAQSACILLQDVMTAGRLPVYTGLNQVKFRAPVVPGDTVETRYRIKRVKHPFYFAEGTVTVGERLCVSAEFSFAITEA